MTSAKSKICCVNKTDIDFFRHLHAVKVATFNQINDHVYRYPVKHVLYKRLRKFEKAGLIQAFYHPNVHPRKVFRLTKKGFKSYVGTGDGESRIQLGSASVAHDLDLGDIRHRLLNDQIASSYITENVLKTWESLSTAPHLFPYAQTGCDGVAEIPLGRGTVRFAIEYEANIKHWHRYDDILTRYYNNQGIPFVIYVCGSNKILWELKSKDRGMFRDHDPKIFYVGFEELCEGKTVDLVNRELKTLRIYPKNVRSDQGQCEVKSSLA